MFQDMMLVGIKSLNSTVGHAVVLKECNQNEFVLQNSYRGKDEFIRIPKGLKTQKILKLRNLLSTKFGHSDADIEATFDRFSKDKIIWDITGNNKILCDEGWAVEFNLNIPWHTMSTIFL